MKAASVTASDSSAIYSSLITPKSDNSPLGQHVLLEIDAY